MLGTREQAEGHDLRIVVAPTKPPLVVEEDLDGGAGANAASLLLGPPRGHTHSVCMLGMRLGEEDFAI